MYGNLIRTAGLAANMRPPVFEVVSLSARHGEHTAQARGKRQVEPGWTEVYPEEEMTLCRELPEDPSLLEALAFGPLAIERADVIETRIGGAGPLGVADLIRVMKDEKVGRPSTYASHVEAMFECVDIGWLSLDEAGRFRVTEAGRAVLDVLADPALPTLGKSYTAELEADLDAIERGEKNPAQVLRRHLGRLPGVETNIPANALETISESDEPDKTAGERFQPWMPIAIWAISSLITAQKMPFATMKSVCASVSCPWETTLPAFCSGAISTIVRFCAACMAMACAFGVLGALTRQSASLIGCSG
jgi:DNA topoisomerase IA